MKTQYILTEEEHDKIVRILEDMDADLGSLVNHMDEYDNVEKYAKCLSVSLCILSGSLNRD